mmetsp:Transcript_106230/g.307465  ORF Transcript_106230/g.307465 Transcript_106230/m.307465 type:complete len:253 (+) Transcript_106230:458-1216(+)
MSRSHRCRTKVSKMAVRPFLAAMWRAGRPRPFGTFSRTLPPFLCMPCAFNNMSTISAFPQNTEAVSGVQPEESRWFTSIPFLNMACACANSRELMLRMKSLLVCLLSSMSWSLDAGACSRPKAILRMLSFLARAARKAMQSWSLLWSLGFAPCSSSTRMKSSSDLSVAYNKVCVPVASVTFGSAFFSRSCSAAVTMSGSMRFAPRTFSRRRSLAFLSKLLFSCSIFFDVSSVTALQTSKNLRLPRTACTPSM